MAVSCLLTGSRRVVWIVCLSSTSRLTQARQHGGDRVPRVRMGATLCLETKAQNRHTVTSAACCWPKQVTKPVQIQGVGNRCHLLKGRAAKWHCKELSTGKGTIVTISANNVPHGGKPYF